MHPSSRCAIPRTQRLAERAFGRFQRFLEIEAASGILLLLAAAIALIWANSAWSQHYYDLWHLPLGIRIGEWSYSQSLHFWINDGLMTLFFLVVGMEVRHELHAGSLRDKRQAALPVFAALGGVLVPALIYLALNQDAARVHGWAIPTATDIAFAVGVLALLGKRVPANVRIFLLTLAIIDDVVAVLLIALFYSGGLDYSGLLVAAAGILLVLVLQRMGIGRAWAYVLPGALIWLGLLKTGAHPTLAGVVLGLMTPVVPVQRSEPALQRLSKVAQQLLEQPSDAHALSVLQRVEREVLPPVSRVQWLLHPWVAFAVMPLFALANAGVSLGGVDLAHLGAGWVTFGVALALVLGKPIGVVSCSWLLVRLGWCQLPQGVNWQGIWLVGLLAGIGFTMSIFIAMLAFADADLLSAAKLGVLLASVVAALLGLTWGAWCYRKGPATDA